MPGAPFQEPRVISLIASATEIVAALGLESCLVGRSHECDFPESIRTLPVCTAAKVDVNASGAEIDRQIKSLLRNAVSIYDLDFDALSRLKPDVLITQSQCEVCAVSLRDVEQVVCRLIGSRPRIVSLSPNSLSGIWHDIEAVAEALEVGARGRDLLDTLEARLDAIRTRVARIPKRPRVACIEWIDPLMAGGNWVPELVEIAGGINLFGEAGRHSPWMTWEELRDGDPDVIVVLPCGWDLSRTCREMGPLTDRGDWNRLSAVRNGQVYVTDGNQYFNRPGPRVVESAEIFSEILHPEEFAYGHRGRGFSRFSG
jgi:iron complex transport system substrate-binding protein